MDIKVKAEKSVTPPAENATVGTETVTETQPMLPPATESVNQTNAQLQQISAKVSTFLEQLPVYISRFFQSYKSPLITFGLFLAAIVTLRVLFAIIDAINGIPLFASIFEVIGVGYTTWFVYRYLLQASTRQELATKIQSLRQDIVGESSESS